MLIKPHLQLNRATDISVQLLLERGIDTLILDVDNTLCIRKGAEILPGILQWLDDLRAAGIKLIILSNAMPSRMQGIAARFSLPFVGLGGKPLPFGFLRAMKRMGSKAKHTAIVGDQLFTDMLGGHLAGCQTLLVCPVEKETAATLRLKRWLERPLLKAWGMQCDFKKREL